jgi:hypothetical protein
VDPEDMSFCPILVVLAQWWDDKTFEFRYRSDPLFAATKRTRRDYEKQRTWLRELAAQGKENSVYLIQAYRNYTKAGTVCEFNAHDIPAE